MHDAGKTEGKKGKEEKYKITYS